MKLAQMLLKTEDLGVKVVHSFMPMYVFVGAAVVLYLWTAIAQKQGMSLKALFRYTFPKGVWLTASTKVDAAIFLISKATQKFLTLFSILILSTASALLLPKLPASAIPATINQHHGLYIGATALVTFILADFGMFYSHYIQHRIPALWAFHKVHHSATFLTPLTTNRFHPIGDIIDTIVVSACILPPIIFAEAVLHMTPIMVLVLYAGIDTACKFLFIRHLQHTHLRVRFGILERIVISPLMHQVHHSAKKEHWDKNFGGVLSVWDWMFGTALILPRGEPLVFGIGTAEDARGDYSTVVSCYTRPVVDFSGHVWDALMGRPPKASPEAIMVGGQTVPAGQSLPQEG